MAEVQTYRAINQINDRNPELHDLYRINIETGEKSLVQKNEGFSQFVTDDDYNVRFAVRSTPLGGNEILMPTNEGHWAAVMNIAMADSLRNVHEIN